MKLIKTNKKAIKKISEKSICGNYNLDKRHGQCFDFQSLKFDFKTLIFSESFSFCGTKFHVFWPKYAIASNLIFLVSKLEKCLVLYGMYLLRCYS